MSLWVVGKWGEWKETYGRVVWRVWNNLAHRHTRAQESSTRAWNEIHGTIFIHRPLLYREFKCTSTGSCTMALTTKACKQHLMIRFVGKKMFDYLLNFSSSMLLLCTLSAVLVYLESINLVYTSLNIYMRILSSIELRQYYHGTATGGAAAAIFLSHCRIERLLIPVRSVRRIFAYFCRPRCSMQ